MAQHIVSADGSLDRFYKHSGLSTTVQYFASAPIAGPRNITLDDKFNVLMLSSGHVYQQLAIGNVTTASFAVPGASPYGVAWDGANVITGDSGTSLIYQHSGFSASILATFDPTEATAINAVEWDGADVLVADGSKVYKYSGFSNVLKTSFATPTGNNREIHWDGTDMWTMDNTIIYHHSGFSSAVLETFAVPGGNPTGLSVLEADYRVWVPNPGTLELNKFALDGTALFDGAGLNTVRQTQAIAVDDRGNVYFTNRNAAGAGQSWGRVQQGAGFIEFFNIGGSPNEVRGIDYDQEGNIWIAVNGLDSVQKWSPDGTMIASYPVGTSPVALVVDGNRHVWVGDSVSGLISKFSLTGLRLTTYDIGTGISELAVQPDNSAVWCGHGGTNAVSKNTQHGEKLFTVSVAVPAAIAVDNNGDVWAIDHFNTRIVKIDGSNGVILATVTVGAKPLGLAVDSGNNVWCLNLDSNNITKISAAGTVLGTYDSEGGNPRALGDFIGYGKTLFPDASTSQFNANLWVYDIATDSFDGSVLVYVDATDPFDGSLTVYDVASDPFDGDILVYDVVSDLFDGNIVVVETVTDPFDGSIAVYDVATKQFDGNTFIYSATTRLFDARADIAEAGTAAFNGKVVIYNIATDLFDGTIIVADTTVALFDGKMNVTEAGVKDFDGAITVLDAGVDDFDGKLMVADSAIVLFDGLFLVEIVGETNFDGRLQIQDVAFAVYDGLLVVFNQVATPFDGKLNVLTPVMAYFEGSVEVYGAPDRYDGFLTVTETRVVRGFSGELFITQGEITDGGMSTTVCLTRVEFIVETSDVLVAPRYTPPDVGSQQTAARPPVFALPNPLPTVIDPRET